MPAVLQRGGGGSGAAHPLIDQAPSRPRGRRRRALRFAALEGGAEAGGAVVGVSGSVVGVVTLDI